MKIIIASNGINQGTIGWLAKEIKKGSLSFTEDNLNRNGNHGLWLNGPDGLKQILAAFNFYGDDEYYGRTSTVEYETVEVFEPGYRCQLWTDAAWRKLLEIAEKWCDECNTAIENEKDIKINILRVNS